MNKPPDPPARPSVDDSSHVLLGRIVRNGLSRASQTPPSPAEHLYRSAPAGRGWAWLPMSLGGLAATAAALFLIFGRGDGEPPALAYLFEGAAAGERNGVGAAGLIQEGTLRFSDGSTVAIREGGRARLRAVSAGGARLLVLDGRARARIASNRSNEWAFEAGPYRVLPSDLATSLELNWLAKRELLLVSVRSGRASVQGASAGARGVVLGQGETFLARASDGLARVGTGQRPARLPGPRRRRAGQRRAHRPGRRGGQGPRRRGPPALPDGRVAGAERGRVLPPAREQPGGRSAARSRPGQSRLLPALRRRAHRQGPAGAALERLVGPSRAERVPQIQRRCRGNRVPDFSYSGYQGGGVALPKVTAAPGPFPLLPGASGDDTAAIQAAIDSVSALPPDAQGLRGAVELGPGVFTLAGSLRMMVGGVVLRGQGIEGTSATVLRAVGAPRTVLQLGPEKVKRRAGKEMLPISDVYVPVGARTFTVERVGDLKVGDDIMVNRPKTQRWICAIGADFFPVRRDGKAPKPWRPGGGLTFERRITRIDGNRITVDVPLTNALEKEFTQAYVTKLDFPERVAEVGVERLAGRGEFTQDGACPKGKAKFIRLYAVANAWVREVRVEGYGGEGVVLEPSPSGSPSRRSTYQGVEAEKCDQIGLQRGRAAEPDHAQPRPSVPMSPRSSPATEVEGPNAVVDLLAVGRPCGCACPRAGRPASSSTTSACRTATGQPSGDFDLARGRRTWAGRRSTRWSGTARRRRSASTIRPPPATG